MATEVVVVVLTVCLTYVSVQIRQRMHLIGWQNTWEQAPGVPATLPRPDGGETPGRAPVYTALKTHLVKPRRAKTCNCGELRSVLHVRTPCPVVTTTGM